MIEKIIDIEFCTLKFSDNYMITIVKEGIHIDESHNEILINIAEEHYQGKPFVYITYRVNSYSVNPNIYTKTSLMNNLLGFAVVSLDYNAKNNAQIEKLFLKKPFEIFSNLEDAYVWANKLVNNR